MEARGVYTAERAAALSGVPKSTVHYWSNNDVLVPSISPQRVTLWSYGDLMALRTIYWLRQTKQDPAGREIPRTAMKRYGARCARSRRWSSTSGTRRARRGSRWTAQGTSLIGDERGAQRASGQRILDAEMLDLLAPFDSREGLRSPDLSAPRPQLRIVPGKLAGSPHIERTRIETQALAALERRGIENAKIYRLYPMVPTGAVNDAIDLER